MKAIPSCKEISEAHQRISPYLHRTQVLTSSHINSLVGGELFFKCENFQKVGAFKARGAMNALLLLKENGNVKSVATHSSGNHAQAVAYSAALLEMEAHIVMPETAPKVKKQAVLDYGARVIECKPTLQAREDTLNEVVKQTGAEVVHPYNDYRIISGQATAAKELFEQVENLQNIIAPVGGGGLLSGTILATACFNNTCFVYAGEPEGADDAQKSVIEGKIIPSVNPKTIADGLLTTLGDKNFPIIKKGIKKVLTVSDSEIVSAMRLIWERMKIVVEPSGAVPLAAVIRNKELFKNKRTGIIISGGNIDLEVFFEQFSLGK